MLLGKEINFIVSLILDIRDPILSRVQLFVVSHWPLWTTTCNLLVASFLPTCISKLWF